jgi:hypothetical protein
MKYTIHAIAITPYRMAGFKSFFLNMRIVKGTGKMKIQPRTHSHVFLFAGAGCP